MWLTGFTAISITLPPVTAGPILLNESPEREIFFSESGSELFCAIQAEERISNKFNTIEKFSFCIVMTLKYLWNDDT